MSKKALLIGINYIDTDLELRGCINDVISIKSFIMREYGFTENEIIMLTEVSKKKQPTKQNIINYLKWLVKDIDENSRLFLHYSGHGSVLSKFQNQNDNQNESNINDKLICPLDYKKTGFITDQNVYQIFQPLFDEKQGAKLTAIFDCCNNNTLLNLRCKYRVQQTDDSTNYSINIDKPFNNTIGNVCILSGCYHQDITNDDIIEGFEQGAITYGLLKTYKKMKQKDKQPSYKSIIKNLTYFDKKRKFKQIPQMSTGFLIDLNQQFSIV